MPADKTSFTFVPGSLMQGCVVTVFFFCGTRLSLATRQTEPILPVTYGRKNLVRAEFFGCLERCITALAELRALRKPLSASSQPAPAVIRMAVALYGFSKTASWRLALTEASAADPLSLAARFSNRARTARRARRSRIRIAVLVTPNTRATSSMVAPSN